MKHKSILRFAVMSDLHYRNGSVRERERFRDAMNAIYNYSDGEEYKVLDALYIIGDFTDRGLPEQLEAMREDCKSFVKADTKLVLTLANHELHYVPDMNQVLEDFQRIFAMPCDRHEIIKGYHFISLSTTISAGPWHDSFDEGKRIYLKNELDKAILDTPNKPIFVFQHPGQVGTVAGGRFGHDEIYDILKEYPNIIDFSGHSHMPVNSPLEIHQNDYTSVSTGSLQTIQLVCKQIFPDFDAQLYNASDCAHLLVVEVDENGSVLIKHLDADEGEFFENEIIIDNITDKSKYKYTEKRASLAPTPYFADNAEFTASYNGNTVKLNFSAAKCDGERVFGYNIKIKSKDTVITEKNIFSDFPKLRQKDTYTFDFELDVDISNTKEKLFAELRAVGFWDNYSSPIKAEID